MSSPLSDADSLPPQDQAEAAPTIDESGDVCTVDYHGARLGTKEELLAECGIDMAIWEIDRCVTNGWEVTGKKKADGEDRIWKSANRQIKCFLKRRAPKFVQEGIKALLADWHPEPLEPIDRPDTTGEEFMLELALHDAHFGKLCWAPQVGHHYDVKIATSDFCGAVDDLLRRVRGFNIRKIVMPIGSDFLHVNNWLGTTANGTPIESTDDRKSKVFEVGCRVIEQVIRRCREIADVEFFYLGGNHDRESSWNVAFWLAGRFENDPHVSIDYGVKERKYLRYGPALIGFAHGDEIKLDKLPLLMPVEAEDLWAGSLHRHWHTGHLHKKAQTRHTIGDTFNGVEVWTLPSLSGTDAWHYRKGFVGNVRAAEAYLWSNKEGYAGHFSVNARSDKAEAA